VKLTLKDNTKFMCNYYLIMIFILFFCFIICFIYFFSLSPPPFTSFPTSSSLPCAAPVNASLRRGQVLLDYDAESPEELSLMAHEVLNIYEICPTDEDYLLGERGSRCGRVPRAYIKLIS